MIDVKKIQGCVEFINLREFYVKDNEEGVSEIIYNNEHDWHVQIENENLETIKFLKIDHCIITKYNSNPRCDFGLLGLEKLYFVEIKKYKKNSLKKKKRKEARDQLSASIVYFKEQGLKDLTKVHAVISLVPKISYQRQEFIVRTSSQIALANFQKECGCPNLYEGNLIKF